MALNVNNNGTADGGQSIKIRTGSFDLDNSYPTGGYPVDISALGIRTIHHLVVEDKGGFVFSFDRANQKLIVRNFNYPAAAAGTATEVTNGTDLSATTDVGFVAFGQP